VEHLTAAVVNDEIFTHICTGFTDQEPAIREATVKVCCRIRQSFFLLMAFEKTKVKLFLNG